MASATGTVRNPKRPLPPEAGMNARAFLRALLDSSVGAKILVALTGAGLVIFTVGHMVGNLKAFQGPDALNRYAYFLQHDIGVLLWVARIGLLTIFLLHLVLAVRLQLRSRAARPVGYAYARTVQAKVASRTMLTTGVVVGLFVLFHLAHYTLGWVKPAVFDVPVLAADGAGGVREVPPGTPVHYKDLRHALPDGSKVHDVYAMTVSGFRNPYIVVLYLVAQLVLFVHLRHGIPSLFQTLGLKNARFAGPIDVLGALVALAVLVGNCAIVLAVWLDYIPLAARAVG